MSAEDNLNNNSINFINKDNNDETNYFNLNNFENDSVNDDDIIKKSENEKNNLINKNKIVTNSSIKESKSTAYSNNSVNDIYDFEEITKHIFSNINEINNSIIVGDNENLIQNLYVNLINCLTDKKICFLVSNMKKFDEVYNILNEKIGKTKNILSIQGGRGKKLKNDYVKFQDFINSGDIFLVIADVFYKLLSTGFVKIFQFNILLIDECHLCEGNHPYNLILSEFYYYYYYISVKNKTNLINKLPNIIGSFNTIDIDANLLDNEEKCLSLLTNLSENLNCQIIITNQELIEHQNMNIVENVKIENHLKETKSINIIYQIIEHYFTIKMLNLGINNYIKLNGISKNLNDDNKESIIKNYIEINNKKFFTESFVEYTNIESSEKQLHFLSQGSYIFQILENIQKYIIILLQNLDLQSILNLFEEYIKLYEKNLKIIEDYNVKNEIKTIIGIITDTKNAFQYIKDKKKFNYINDRIIKLLNILNNIDTNKKIIIFVPTRKLTYVLNNFLIQKKYKSDYISGIYIKKEESISNLLLSTKIKPNEIKERCLKFNNNEINILICTTQITDLLKIINSCDITIIFNELSSNDFIKIKNFNDKYKSKIIIFSENNNINDINFDFKNKLYNFFENNENCRNFRRQNYLETKINEIGKQYLYKISETDAKLSLKNVMSLFNEINNVFLNQGVKIIINKEFKEEIIDKVKNFKCKIELWNGTKVYSHVCKDKQTAENECYLQTVVFLHKKNKIDNNFKVILKNL